MICDPAGEILAGFSISNRGSVPLAYRHDRSPPAADGNGRAASNFSRPCEFKPMFWSHHHQRYATFEEIVMADFTKLNADIAALSAKVDALLAKQNPPPVDEQPQVDAADQAVEAIAAKIPS